jgi:hypothetical protein
MPTARPKSKALWIISVLLAAILLVGGGGLFFQSKAKARARQENLKQAETVTRNYIEAMAARDITKAVSYMALSDEKRQAMLKRESEKPVAQRGPSIELISVGPARFAPDNSGKILVRETVSMMNRKITDDATVVYDETRGCWLVQLDD